MSIDTAPREEDRVSILSFDNLEEDYGLPGSDSTRIHHWLSQQCRFGLEEKELPPVPYAPGELLSTVLANHRDSSSTISEEGGEAALRADSPLLGFGVDGERTLEDPLYFPSATYVRDLPDYRTLSSRSRSTSTSSSSPRTMGLVIPTLSRRPSLLRKPSLPLLGELDDESQAQAISAPLPTPPQPGRSRAHSNASISSFHLPTSMQQSTPPLTPLSPTPFILRHTRKPITPPSSLSSFTFGGVRTRPHSQLHGHHPAHRYHPPTPQKIPHTLSRSSSALSLLSPSANNRNAVYIDEMIDIADNHATESGDSIDLGVMKSGGEGLRNEEGGYHTTSLIPSPTINSSNTGGVNFNALRSSQVYLGIGTNTKPPIRPPPAPPLIIDSHQHDQHQHDQGEDDKSSMSRSRWSLTSSIDEIPTPAGSGVAAAFGVGGGGSGLFGSRKRMSLIGDKIDKAKSVEDGKERDDEEKEKEVVPIEENEKEKSKDKKRGRLVSFISRISSNKIAPPPPVTLQNTPFQNVTRSSSY